jgi:small subunit ribosomal protein S13
LKNAGISEDKKVNEWNDDELAAIRTYISENVK